MEDFTVSLPIGTGTRIFALNPESINILRICETARSHNFRANRREKPAADASFSNYRRRFRGARTKLIGEKRCYRRVPMRLGQVNQSFETK